MRNKYLFLSLLVLFPLCGCSNMEYDPTGKLNKEIALFHDGISLPVGNVGPVTVSDLMGNGSIRNLINEFMKEEADGRMYVEAAEDFFNKSAYEVALNSPDNTKPYHWEIGDVHGTVNSMSSALSMFGFCFPHQMLIVQMANPVYRDIPLNAKVRIACSAPDYSESYSKEEQLTDFSVPSSRTERTLVQFDLPEDVVDLLSKVDLLGLTLDLPENLPEKLREGSASFFRFSYKYKSFVALAENFSFSYTYPVNGLNVPVGQFGLHECELSFDLVNTLPIDVTINSVRILDEDGMVDPGIVVSSDLQIAGGTIESPATTPVTLSVKSLDGAIPDIAGVEVAFSLKTPDGLARVPLSSKMSLTVKSASVTVSGGITVPSDVF